MKENSYFEELAFALLEALEIENKEIPTEVVEGLPNVTYRVTKEYMEGNQIVSE